MLLGLFANINQMKYFQDSSLYAKRWLTDEKIPASTPNVGIAEAIDPGPAQSRHKPAFVSKPVNRRNGLLQSSNVL